MVLAEPQAFLRCELVGNGCLPFHDGIHRDRRSVRTGCPAWLSGREKPASPRETRRKKDCQQAHANLIQLGAGEGESAGGETPAVPPKKRQARNVPRRRIPGFWIMRESGSVLAEAGKVLMGGGQHVRHEYFPGFGVALGHGDARGQIGPGRVPPCGGPASGASGFPYGLQPWRGLLGPVRACWA